MPLESLNSGLSLVYSLGIVAFTKGLSALTGKLVGFTSQEM
jgi:hypothetical protein